MAVIVTTLISFNGADGSDPFGGLVIDAEGDLFGTTTGGGDNGTVFEIVNASSGYASTPTTLVTFSYPGLPFGGLTADANGNLFGATAFGWDVFEIAKTASGYANTPTALVTAGGPPSGALIADANGDLFGTTSGGFASNGTVFEVAKTASGYASTSTVLYSFNGGADGASPLGGLTMDANGDLFGTTEYGGAYGFTNGPGLVGDGTVFEIVKTASGYASTPTTLVSFSGADGDIPCGSLIADANGDLFGTTYAGGADNAGEVFEIAKTATGYSSTPTVLASFNGADGASPFGSLIMDANGDLFGTTSYAGAYGWGTVFEIANTASGYASAPTTLVNFNGADGSSPFGNLVADADGDLFGTTSEGGASNGGTVFEIAGSGFSSTGTVVEDLTSLPYESSYEAVWQPMTNTLSIVDSANSDNTVFSSQLVGSFAGDAFNLSNDGGGGTEVTAVAEPWANVHSGDELISSVTGQSSVGYEKLFNGGAYIGTDLFYVADPGQSYNFYGDDYASGGQFIGSQFFYPGTPGGSSYYEVDYNQANVFAGEKLFWTNVTGQEYTGKEEDFDANDSLTSVLLTGVDNQAYSSVELDYSEGTYTGYKAYYDATDEPYTNQELDVSASGQLEKVVYSGMTSTPYSSVEQDYSGGALSDAIFGFTDATGATYNAYQVEDDTSGTALQETLDFNGGDHALYALTPGQTLTSLGDDTMTGSATGSTHFVFNAVYGADTIANLTSADTVSLPSSEFANFNAMFGMAQNLGADVVITAADGDTLTLKNMTTAALAGMSANFAFPA
jgi:uncharacterized repeat protein (TIGR03803 family)